MGSRLVGRRVRGLLAGAAAGLLTLAVLTAAATAADPALTETDVQMVIPVTVLADNPCTGEPVVLQGHLFLREHITLTPGATHLTVSTSTNTQGVTGVNPITGVKYVASDVDTFTATIQKSTSASGRQHILFSRSGESAPVPDDFYLHYLIHFSWNAAGTITTDITNFSSDCR
jgi:hypothetical protein